MIGSTLSHDAVEALEGAHLPARPQEVFKELLDWLDRYLGPVGR